MADLSQLNKKELEELFQELQNEYDAFKARGVQLDMTRGKPCAEQLDLSLDMLTCVDSTNYRASDGTDCRNYGGLDGLPEAKAYYNGKLYGSKADGDDEDGGSLKVFAEAGLKPVELGAKEAMGLTNGSNFIAALAAFAVRDAELLIKNASISTALSLEAIRGEKDAFSGSGYCSPDRI